MPASLIFIGCDFCTAASSIRQDSEGILEGNLWFFYLFVLFQHMASEFRRASLVVTALLNHLNIAVILFLSKS